MELCRRVEMLLPDGSGLRCSLPSEAQWEYSCRAGVSTPFSCGETITPVGMFPANGWGLHDMHGNVWEWCLDHWHGTYDDAPFDGRAWIDPAAKDSEAEEEQSRLLRGGSWGNRPGSCRSAYRSYDLPDGRNFCIGFRVCCLPQD